MTTESQRHNNREDEISLKDLIQNIQKWWQHLLTKWITIVLFGLIGGTIGFLYAIIKKPIFTATTTFVLEDEKTGVGLGNLAGLASMAGVDFGGSGGGIFQGDNILGLYKSRMMLEQTLLSPLENTKHKLLIDRYIDLNKLKDKWANNPKLLKLDFNPKKLADGNLYIKPNRLRDSVLALIVADLNKNYLTVVKPDKKLSAIQVDVTSADEIFAKTFNDALVKNVNQFYVNTKTKKTLANVQILQHKTDSVRAVMNGAIYSAVAVADATPNLNPTRQVQRVAPAQRAQFSAETNKAILGEMVKNLEMSKMSLLRETPLIQVIDQPIYPLKKDKFSRLKSIILGGILFGFLTVMFLTARMIFKSILN